MLDLNMESKHNHETQIDDSASSNSSILNGDEDSCSNKETTLNLGFQLEILNEKEVFVTKDLFPMPPAKYLAAAADEAVLAGNEVVRVLPKKSRRGPRSRSSQYRGVTFYRRTGRWESHIWDCGKQVYLGGFDTAHAAARAYDRAAIKFRGVEADINFNLCDYDEDLKQIGNLSKEEFVHILRRQSTGFSRGSSKYRGVTLHKCGRWEARMGQFLGKKAYDKAAIKCNGKEAVTNFEPSSYEGDILPDVDSEAIGHDLDLNLRISQPNVSSPKRGENQIGVQFQFGSYEALDAKKARVDSPSFNHRTQLHSLEMTSELPQARNSLYPGFFPFTEDISKERRPIFNSPNLRNWSWQTQGSATPLSHFTSAASSGFSTTAPTTPYLNQFSPPSSATYYHSRS